MKLKLNRLDAANKVQKLYRKHYRQNKCVNSKQKHQLNTYDWNWSVSSKNELCSFSFERMQLNIEYENNAYIQSPG